MTWLNSFFPTKVSLLFIFKPWAEQKKTRSYLTLTSPSQNICLFAVIDVYSALEFPICEKKLCFLKLTGQTLSIDFYVFVCAAVHKDLSLI